MEAVDGEEVELAVEAEALVGEEAKAAKAVALVGEEETSNNKIVVVTNPIYYRCSVDDGFVSPFDLN